MAGSIPDIYFTIDTTGSYDCTEYIRFKDDCTEYIRFKDDCMEYIRFKDDCKEYIRFKDNCTEYIRFVFFYSWFPFILELAYLKS